VDGTGRVSCQETGFVTGWTEPLSFTSEELVSVSLVLLLGYQNIK
jgi:hypothetical protein